MELAYCVPLGVPHSTFLGWPTDDQDKALAWQADRAGTCRSCGTRPDEWDPKRGGSLTAWVAEPSRCLGCEALGIAERDLQTGAGDDGLLGVRVGLVRPVPDGGGG